MLLEKAIISNYRSCNYIELNLNSFNALIGYNNSGKSNCLKAIKWALDTSAKPATDDFYDLKKPMSVELHFINIPNSIIEQNEKLTASSKTKLRNNVHNGKLHIKKLCQSSTERQVKFELFNHLSNSWEENKTGFNNAIVPILPKIIHIQAMEDAVENVTKIKSGTAISDLLNCFRDLWTADLNNSLCNEFSTIHDKLSLNGKDRLKSFCSFDEEFNQELQPFFPGLNARLDIEPPSIEDILKGIFFKLSDTSGPAKDVSYFGQGAQRCLQMALLKYLATKSSKTNLFNSCILMIDEPELYLHPIMIDLIRSSLIKLSENGFQIIITTHSPLLLDQEQTFKGAIIIKKDSSGTYTKTHITNINSKSFAEEFDIFENKGYALFAERVILIEGETEQYVLPKILKSYNPSLATKIAFVNVRGCSKLQAMNDLCTQLGLDTYITADLDYVKRLFNTKNKTLNDYLNELKQLFKKLKEDRNDFLLDENYWPKSGGQNTPEKMWEIAAIKSPELTKKIHDVLLKENLWVWPTGAIETIMETDSFRKKQTAKEFTVTPQVLERFSSWTNWATQNLS